MSESPTDLVPVILRQIQAEIADIRANMATRAELHAIRDELRNDLRNDLRSEIDGLRVELRSELHAVRDDLRREMRERYGEVAILYASAHAEHERRITNLEVDVEKLPPIPKR